MKVKIVLLPRKISSRPIPYWDIGSIVSNIESRCRKIELIDLETSNYKNKKYNIFFEKFRPLDIFNKRNFCIIQDLIKDIGNINYDIFHFYIDWWNETLPIAIALGHQIKRLNNKTKILLNGPYLNAYGKKILDKFRFIDYIVVSEIEPVFKNLLGNFSSSKKVPNIIYFNKERNKIVETKKEVTDLNNLLFPDFDLFFIKGLPRPKILPFRISRGCKYRCFFCACLTAEKLRYYQDINMVVSQLLNYKNRYNVKNFYFDDDALNFNNDYLESFLDKSIKARLNIKWSAYFIPKDLSFALLKKTKKAGCIHIRWGIESVDPYISGRISKNISILEAEKILRESSKLGISNQISFIVGFPHEKKESVDLMKKFILKNRNYLRVVNAYSFKPRVGTLAYKFPNRYGIKILKDETIFKRDEVPFDEVNGLKWKAKRIQQQLFLRHINGFIKGNGLLDIYPQEYFKQII